MSQRRTNVVVFASSKTGSPNWSPSRLDGVKCKMLPGRSSDSRLMTKVALLHLLRPHAADLVEKLVDDLLVEVP